MHRRLVLLVGALLALASCVTNPVPKGYTGPVAYIADSKGPHGRSSIDIFFLSKYNGEDVDNLYSRTSAGSSGMGPSIVNVDEQRDVPLQQATFTIMAQTYYAMPIIAMVNRNYAIEQTLTFTPLEGHHYIVKGKLGDDYCAVWLEDTATGEIIGTKKEIKGASYYNISGEIVTKPAP